MIKNELLRNLKSSLSKVLEASEENPVSISEVKQAWSNSNKYFNSPEFKKYRMNFASLSGLVPQKLKDKKNIYYNNFVEFIQYWGKVNQKLKLNNLNEIALDLGVLRTNVELIDIHSQEFDEIFSSQ